MYVVSHGSSHTLSRLLTGIYIRDVLEVLQGMGDDTPAGPRLRIEEWYRPHLGRFQTIDKGEVLCHAEDSGMHSAKWNNVEQAAPSSILGQPLENNTGCFDGTRSPMVPTDSLIYSNLMESALWPNSEGGVDAGQHPSQSTQTTEGFVSPCPLVLYI